MRSLKCLAAAVGLVISAAPAAADAIDGNWCHDDGRRFTIRGPQIVTPGGAAMQDDYGRHSFSYKPPVPEQGAGGVVYMTLRGENLVLLRYGDASAANPESWVRCSPSISALTGKARS